MDKPAILSNPEAFVVVPVAPVAWLRNTKVCGDPEFAVSESYADGSFAAFAAPVPTALADIVAYCAALEARLAEAERVIDGIVTHDFAADCQECGIGSTELFRAARTWKEKANG